MAGSSSSISYILSKAAASSFLRTTAPPKTEPSHLFQSNTFWNSTMLTLETNNSDVHRQNETMNGLLLSEVNWKTDNNYSNESFENFSISAGDLLGESWWNVFDEKYMRHSMAWTITLVVAYMLILIVGVIGNFMVILVILLRPQMRSVTNMFIMNLAVADLFVIVFCVPATLMSNIFTRSAWVRNKILRLILFLSFFLLAWILGSFMCKGVAYVQGVSVCASAYSLVAISLDRCKAIYRPFDRPSGLSRSQALVTTCLIWVTALMLTIPWAVIFNVNTSNINNLPSCLETWENEYHGKLYFLIVNFFLCYCSPLLLISISNLAIWCHVNRRKVPQESASAGPIKKMHKKARQGVLKMLGVVTLTFLLSWLPLYVIVMRMKFGENISDYEYDLLAFLMPFAQWLGSWNSCINPILYAFLNKNFRTMFKSLLLSCSRRNNFETFGSCRQSPYRSNNGTTVGINRTSYTSVYISRGSERSSSIRTRLHRHRSQNSNCSSRSLIVSNFRETGRSTRVTTTSIVTIGVTSGTCTRNNAMRTSTGHITDL